MPIPTENPKVRVFSSDHLEKERLASKRINAIAPYFSKRAINEITTKINGLEKTKEPLEKHKAARHIRLKDDAKHLSIKLKEIRYQAHCTIKSTVESFDATLSENFLELKKQLTHRFHCILNVAEIYIDLLQNNAEKSEAHKFVIASVPSSTAGNQIHPISLVAQYVAKATGNIDGTRLITRTESIKSVHSGGHTGVEHRKTGLAIDPSLNGKTVLIIDDIVNSGNSFRAVLQELKRVCPDATFVCLALARTVNRCTIQFEDSTFEQLLQKEIKRKKNGTKCFKTTFNNIETATWHCQPIDASKKPRKVTVTSSSKYRSKITPDNIIDNYKTRSAYKECFARIKSHLQSHDRDDSDDSGDDNTPLTNPFAKKSTVIKASSYAGRTISSRKSGEKPSSSHAASSIATDLAHAELGGEQIFEFDSRLFVEPDEGYIKSIENMTEEEIAHTVIDEIDDFRATLFSEFGDIEANRGFTHVRITDLSESHDFIGTPEIPPHSGESSLATTPALSRLASVDSTLGKAIPHLHPEHLFLFNQFTHNEIKPIVEESADNSMSVVKATDDDSYFKP